jgi:hypothetical protein
MAYFAKISYPELLGTILEGAIRREKGCMNLPRKSLA